MNRKATAAAFGLVLTALFTVSAEAQVARDYMPPPPPAPAPPRPGMPALSIEQSIRVMEARDANRPKASRPLTRDDVAAGATHRPIPPAERLSR